MTVQVDYRNHPAHTVSKAAFWVLVGQLLDAVTFTAFYTIVPAAILLELGKVERNPVILTLFAAGGFLAVVVVKFGVSGLIIWLVGGRIKARPRKLTALMLVVGASGYVGATANLIALFTVMEAIG